SSQPLKIRCAARTSKDTGRPKPDIIEQNDENIGRSRRRSQFPDGWKFGVRIFGIVSRQTHVTLVGDRENCSLNVVLCTHWLFFRSQSLFLGTLQRGSVLPTGRTHTPPKSSRQ